MKKGCVKLQRETLYDEVLKKIVSNDDAMNNKM
jgi:hypothetical protein